MSDLQIMLGNIARGALVELLGTFVITFISCSAAVQNDTVMPVAIAYGLSVMCMMFATVGLSGGHLNPALSVALYVTRIQSFTRTLVYVIAQLCGAVGAVFVLRLTIPVAMQRMEQSAKAFHGPLGGSTSSYNLAPLQCFFFEATISFLVAFVYFCTLIDPPVRGPERKLLAPIPVGFAVTLGMLATANFSGGCFNPARAFGPALVMNFWVDFWPYALGPLLGALLAGLFHRFVLLPRHELLWAKSAHRVAAPSTPETTPLMNR